jgi:DNA-binding winged helix-turn-helix (wHTH) protein
MAHRLELNFPNPITKPEDFFDRTVQLELIRGIVEAQAPRIVVIMGERVIGKTSLLNVVLAWAEEEPRLAVLPLAWVSSRGELMEQILEGMAIEAGSSLRLLGYRDQANQFTQSTATGFAAIAAKLTDGGDRTFLVCLDELDSMLKNCDGQSATEILDFIVHASNRSLPIIFVFTLTRATPQIMHTDATPFITAARIADLGPWSAQESRKFVERLLSHGPAVDDSAHELLFAEGGGHPYLTKAILQRIVDARGASVMTGVISAHEVRTGVAAALASPEVHLTFSNIVAAGHFSADELMILRQLAKTPGPLAESDFASAIAALRDLHRRRYVRNESGEFTLAFGLLGRWLLEHASADADQADAHRHGSGIANDPGHGTDIAKLVLDESRQRVFIGDREIRLGPSEYRFLLCLVRERGTVVGRADLAAAVWPGESGFDGGRDSRLAQVVHRLRTALGGENEHAKYIETRRGFGFAAIPQNVEHIPGGER